MAKEKPKSGRGAGNVRLPSAQALAKLPRWAQVAFAARAARRVQPLFKHFWPNAPKEHVDAVDRAITLVERSAVSPDSTSDLQDAANAAYAADNAAQTAAAYASGRAARAAAHASRAGHAAYTAHAVGAKGARAAAHEAAHAARFAADAAYSVAAAGDTADAMRRDYELLKATAEREQWTDDTPLPPEFFGPLWPDGIPNEWPVSPQDIGHLTHPVPREDQISQLPQKAQVAYAARCARRVLPLFLHNWPDAPEPERRWIEMAVELAEGIASAATASHVVFAKGEKERFLTWATTRATGTSSDADGVHDSASQAAWAAEAAASAAFAVLPGIDEKLRPQLAQSAYVAGNAATNAIAASVGLDPYGSEIANDTIRRDFVLLKAAAEREQWTDETPVPPEFFGPLWPNGEPEWWPSANDQSTPYDDMPRFDVWIDRGEATKGDIAELFAAFSDVHRAAGGVGLTFVDAGSDVHSFKGGKT